MKKLSKKYIKTIKDDKGNIAGYGLKGNLESLKQELDQAGQYKKAIKGKDALLRGQAKRISELSQELANLKDVRTSEELALKSKNKWLNDELEKAQKYKNYYYHKLWEIQQIAKVHRYNCFGHKNFGYDNYQRIVELCTQAYTYMPSECEMVLGAPKLYTSPWSNGLWCATVNGYKAV